MTTDKHSNLTIAIANHKGGVGKSSSTASIGAALAMKGYKTLVLDLDAQSNLTYTLLQNQEPETSVYDALVHNSSLPIINVRENLDLVPASLELARVEIDLSTKIAREGILRGLLADAKKKYDYILMDCPPSLGIVTTNALVAADQLYIPLTAEVLPLKGLAMIDDVVNEVKRLVNPDLTLGGVFFTMFSSVKKLNKEVVNMVEQRYGDKVLKSKIRSNVTMAEMPMTGQTIFEYAPSCNAAKDYMALTEELISRCN